MQTPSIKPNQIKPQSQARSYNHYLPSQPLASVRKLSRTYDNSARCLNHTNYQVKKLFVFPGPVTPLAHPHSSSSNKRLHSSKPTRARGPRPPAPTLTPLPPPPPPLPAVGFRPPSPQKPRSHLVAAQRPLGPHDWPPHPTRCKGQRPMPEARPPAKPLPRHPKPQRDTRNPRPWVTETPPRARIHSTWRTACRISCFFAATLTG